MAETVQERESSILRHLLGLASKSGPGSRPSATFGGRPGCGDLTRLSPPRDTLGAAGRLADLGRAGLLPMQQEREACPAAAPARGPGYGPTTAGRAPASIPLAWRGSLSAALGGSHERMAMQQQRQVVDPFRTPAELGFEGVGGAGLAGIPSAFHRPAGPQFFSIGQAVDNTAMFNGLSRQQSFKRENGPLAVEEPVRKRGKHLMERLLWNGAFLRCPGKNCQGVVERATEPRHGEMLMCSVRGCNRKLYYCAYCRRAYVIVTEPDWTLGEHGLEICHMEDKETKRRIVEEACAKYRAAHPGSKRYPPWQRKDIQVDEPRLVRERVTPSSTVSMLMEQWSEAEVRASQAFLEALGVKAAEESAGERGGWPAVPLHVAHVLCRLHDLQSARVMMREMDQASAATSPTSAPDDRTPSRGSSIMEGPAAAAPSAMADKPVSLGMMPDSLSILTAAAAAHAERYHP